MWSLETIAAIGALGNWFAGFGAFAAAVTAIWVAKRSEKVKLEISVGLRKLVGPGDDITKEPEHLSYRITNAGSRPVNIVLFGWQCGRGKHKQSSIQTLSGMPAGNQIPHWLVHGESASFFVHADHLKNVISSLAESITSTKDTKTIRAVIYTSVGKPIYVKPEEHF